jgi:DUF971 family protein
LAGCAQVRSQKGHSPANKVLAGENRLELAEKMSREPTNPMDTPQPTEIKLHQKSRIMEVEFSDGSRFELSFELLRVYSPSAEVRGHGPGQEVLQVGKREVEISALEPVGNYAVQPTFSDGHSTGLYSWDYLFWLGTNRDSLWRQYLERLKEAGASREAGAAPFEQRPQSK